MELSFLLAQQILSLFLMMVVGYLIVKLDLLDVSAGDVLATLGVYVFSPCIIFRSFVKAEFSKETLMGFLIAAFGAVVVHILYIAMSRLGEKIFQFNNIEKASLTYSNAGNFILPLVAATLGEEWVFFSCAYIMINTFVFWTHGKTVICKEKSVDLVKALRNPNNVATVLGFLCFLFGIRLPAIVDSVTASFGNLVGPAGMLVVGILMTNVDFKEVFSNKRAYMICFGRLILYPLITVLFFRFSGIMQLHPQTEQFLLVTVLAAAAPCAANVTQVAQIYHQDAKLAGTLNVMSVIFCILTVPVIVGIYQMM